MSNVKRVVFLTVVLAFIFAPVMVFAGGGQESGGGGDKVKVVLYVNGTLGDKSFFDSAARGNRQSCGRTRYFR